MLPRRFGAVLFALIAALMAAGCGSSDSASQPSSSSSASNRATTSSPVSATTTAPTSTTTTPPERTVDAAIGAFIRSAGHDYAGDCGDTTLSEDVGKHCSVLHEDRGATRVYAIGPTFSEFETWLLLQHRADGWSVTDSASVGTLDNPSPAPW